MKGLIKDIEIALNDKFINIIEKGVDLKLTPIEAVEVFYLYFNQQKLSIDRDKLMMNLADISLKEVSLLFNKIKEEYLLYSQGQE